MNYAGLTDFFEIVIVTLIFSDVSTIKITFCFPYRSVWKPLCCLTSLSFCYIVQFSRCNLLILQSDLKIQYLGSSNPTTNCHRLVGQSGLEPPTSRLSVVCSSQLSYWPSSIVKIMVEIIGIEPMTSCLQGRRSPS